MEATFSLEGTYAPLALSRKSVRDVCSLRLAMRKSRVELDSRLNGLGLIGQISAGVSHLSLEPNRTDPREQGNLPALPANNRV